MRKETAASLDLRNVLSTRATTVAGLLRDLLAKGRPLVMGVLNVTPDSFSDGGRFLDPAAAIAQARRLAAEGADIVELGAAASNVAARPVTPEEEVRRL